MQDKRKLRKTLALIVAVGTMASLDPPASRAAYTPPVTTIRIGLYYNTTELPSSNLENAVGLGSGFEFGYYDVNRDFIPTGAWTNETAISMVMDRNMTWYPGAGGGAGEYREGTGGPVVLGCYHIRMDAYYEEFEQAREAAEPFQDSYVKYESGWFYVMSGQYTSRAGAENAAAERGLAEYSVDAGTTNTIAVVATGTNRVLFEFDFGQTHYLAVRPKPINDEKPETIIRNNRYCGGFQYARLDGMLITVINYVDTEDYVKGILPYEMNNEWPMEALKAQACCARTYALASLNSHSEYGFDLCTTEDCQVYRGRGEANERTDRAVNETAGMYITYNGELCIAYYASSNGGASENSENVWNDALPYLRGVIDPYEADIAPKVLHYYWTITYTPAQITQRLRDRGTNCATIVSMAVSAYTPTGNALSVTMKDANGASFTFSKREDLYSALGVPTQHFNIGNASNIPPGVYVNDPAQMLNIYSDFYAIGSDGVTTAVPDGPMYAITESGSIELISGERPASESSNGMINGVFFISGSGRGHSLGMSQWGAYSMAEFHGKNYVEIIKFYYTGVEVG